MWQSIKNFFSDMFSSKVEIDNVYTTIEKRYVIFPMIAIQREEVSNISAYREFNKGGLMYRKKETDKIFYGNFNKKFIYDKLNITI